MLPRLIYIISITAFPSREHWAEDSCTARGRVDEPSLSQHYFLLLSHLKASSKRGHSTTFQRETRYRHTHMQIPHTQHNTKRGMLHTHTHTHTHTNISNTYPVTLWGRASPLSLPSAWVATALLVPPGPHIRPPDRGSLELRERAEVDAGSEGPWL